MENKEKVAISVYVYDSDNAYTKYISNFEKATETNIWFHRNRVENFLNGASNFLVIESDNRMIYFSKEKMKDMHIEIIYR